MPELKEDEKFMRATLAEASKGVGFTSPNPAVGAVLVRDGRIIARGFHRQAGTPHAEVVCLRKVAEARLCTLYITLEPCSTHGRTGPCVDHIIAREVGRVVIGATDPNPRHRGRAMELLRGAGIEVSFGILETECSQLNEAFNKWISTGEPFVIAKCAMSLDGRLTRPPGESRWLSSAAARAHAHQLRAQVDAIVVGAETIRRDDPRLTARARRASFSPGERVRMSGKTARSFARKQPWRVVLTRSGRLPAAARIFRDTHKERTLVFENKSLRSVLRELGKREVLSVLLEGGGQVLTQALEQCLIDKFQIYIAPLFCGGNVLAFGGKGASSARQAMRMTRPHYERIGQDICMIGYAEQSSESEKT